MPVVAGSPYQQNTSCWDRMKMNMLVGFCVGIATGALFGGYVSLRYGLRGRQLINSVGKTMIQSGTTFGTFMGIGTAIRC
ncbi:reactive oxygen species modulator 1 [Nomia melanderi]|uniref:reactive oxygen species modulator 1 n=1 Tax=Nomia melanderi TaxID=2448451 RepID=UPI0013045E63|nr:reactive oxygen species modulator 1 [Nomia melanderi]